MDENCRRPAPGDSGEVLVISRDYAFARMLELELSGAGINVRLASTLSGSGLGSGYSGSTPVLADLDALEAAGLSALADAPASVCFVKAGELGAVSARLAAEGSDLPDRCRLLERPFDVEALLRLLPALCSPGTRKLPPSPQTAPARAIQLNESALTVNFGTNEIRLTRREFELLAYLMLRRGTPVSREELIREVWKYEYTGNTNVVDVYIRYLREKLDERFGVKLIMTVRGRGYKVKEL